MLRVLGTSIGITFSVVAHSDLLLKISAVFVVVLSVHLATGQQCQYEKNLKANEKFQFFSPRYPKNYPMHSQCNWTITAPPAHTIDVNCPTVKMPQSRNCWMDYLSMNGKKFCSRGRIAANSESNQLDVQFRSVTNLGKFYCEAQSKPDPCTCGARKSVSELL